MKRTILTVAFALLIAAVPAVAGEEKCTAETQDCLDKMVQRFQNRGWVGIELESRRHRRLDHHPRRARQPRRGRGPEGR